MRKLLISLAVFAAVLGALSAIAQDSLPVAQPSYLQKLAALAIGPNNSTLNGTVNIQDATASTGVTTLNVRGGAGQGSTNLANFCNSAVTSCAAVDVNGNITSPSYTTNSGSSTMGYNGLAVEAGKYVGFSSSSSNVFVTPDVVLQRSASGVVEIDNGTVGSGGGLSIPALKSTTGTRYVCISTTGLISSSASACSGT